VPSGWHHVVVNLTDVVSINHNWVNAHSIHWTWALLSRQHAEATAALEDCRWGQRKGGCCMQLGVCCAA
jgi:hypothetical protein